MPNIPESQVYGTTHDVRGLEPGTRYDFRVCAINADAPPDVSPGVTAFATTPSAPNSHEERMSIPATGTVQMAALRPGADPPEHDTIETLLWLCDYHDRIKGTRSTILDIMGIVNLVNTLLIPLLAFLVANREVVFELLGWSI